MALLPLNTCFGKNILTYSLKLLSPPPTIDNGIYVYPTTVSDPNKDYIYSIDLSTNGYNGTLPGMSFTFSLVNGKFDNGKTTMKMSYDSLQLYKLHVKWNDITTNILIDTAYTATIKITQGIIILPSDTTVFQLQKGTNQQFVRKIASLKGQIPSLGAGPNRLINDNSQMQASVTDMEYSGINEGIGSKLVKQFEWTLPTGWRTTSDQYGTFITNPDVKQITIIPDKVNVGSIKVRAVNGIGSAYSEYDSIYFDRGFSFTNYPTSITFGDNTAKTFSTTLFNGITYEWSAPSGWQINGQGNTLEALNLNSVNVTPTFCSQTDGRVRVRLKKDGDISLWYDFKNYQGVPQPSITTNSSTIYQLEETTFSIGNTNLSNIQSISCSGNGIYYVGNQGLDFKVVGLQSGTLTMYVSLLMYGCSTPIVIPITISMQPHRLSINGLSNMCNQTTYTINYLSAGVAVQWNKSSNLSFVSPQGSNPCVFSYTGSGSGWIEASVYGIVLPRKEVWAGVPNSPEMGDCNGLTPPGEPLRDCFTLCFNRFFTEENTRYFDSDQRSNIIEWEWQKQSTNFDWGVNGGNEINFRPRSTNSIITFKGRVRNACGWSQWNYFSLGVVSCEEVLYSIYPNPATDILTIELTTSATISEAKSFSRTTTPYSIQLWNEHRGLVRTVESTESIKQVSLQGLPKGMYFIVLVKDGETINRQILWVK